jgi:hypothetical protein
VRPSDGDVRSRADEHPHFLDQPHWHPKRRRPAAPSFAAGPSFFRSTNARAKNTTGGSGRSIPSQKLKRLEWQPRLLAHGGIKKLSRGLATPPVRPSDAGSRNLGAVGTANWTGIQAVPERTVQRNRKPSANVNSRVTEAQHFALPRLRDSLVRGEHNAQRIAARRPIGAGAGADCGAAS